MSATSMTTITHIVLFQFKPDAKPHDIIDLTQRFYQLKHECLHATTHSPYILSIKGGTDNSIEGAQNGITHAFVVEFATAEDRNYYVKEDPVHQDFIKLAGDILEKAIVVDFEPGIFEMRDRPGESKRPTTYNLP